MPLILTDGTPAPWQYGNPAAAKDMVTVLFELGEQATLEAIEEWVKERNKGKRKKDKVKSFDVALLKAQIKEIAFSLGYIKGSKP